MSRPHRHHEIEINFLERGMVTSLVSGTMETLRGGSLALFWAAVPHQILHTEKAAGFTWITVPLSWVLQWHLPKALVKPLLRGEFVVDGRPSSWDASRVKTWVDMIGRKNSDWKKAALLDIQARLHQLGLSKPISEKKTQRDTPSGSFIKVEQIARFIAENYREPITVDDIAAHTQLHPNYAMNLFRNRSGQTIIECLTQHRIAHAQRLLLTTDDKVLEIALDSGFGSLSRFYTAFTAACGVKPLQYRRVFAKAGAITG